MLISLSVEYLFLLLHRFEAEYAQHHDSDSYRPFCIVHSLRRLQDLYVDTKNHTGLLASIFTMTAVMLVMNILITPIYTHTDVKTVVGMIPKMLLPFNLIKSVLNASITFIIYKPVSQAFKSLHLIPRGNNEFKINSRSVIGLVVAAVLIVCSIALVFVVFDGSFELVKK